MTTILDAIGGLLATSVLAATATTYGGAIGDAARNATDARVAGAQVQQTALMIGRQVENANTLALGQAQVTTLTCATPKCTSFIELDGFKLAKSPGHVALAVRDDEFAVTVTTPRGTTSATFDSATQRTTVTKHTPVRVDPEPERTELDAPAFSWDAISRGFDRWISR